jgi:penicillin-binding protein 2
MKPGTPFHGSAVVIEVDTGQILAMVSTPSFTRDQLQDDPDSIFKDPVGAPWVNKAINKPYPPGSIAKAIVISEAISRAKLGLDEHIACTGHLYENRNDILRCWIYRPEFNMTTHSAVLGHDLDAVDALTVSCNIFSYTVGRRLGPEGITEVYRDFGVDMPLDLGVGEQFNGHVGLFGNDPPPITPFDATLMGMGQGPITWTPLHAANAFATLARGGVWVEPRIIDDGRPPVVRDLELDPRAIGVALQGLHNVVNDSAHGTAYSINYADAGNYPRARIFDVPGVEVWGKTGTAQATEIKVDPDDDPETMNDIILREGDHSWFTALVAPEGERPRYAICVLMEHAGSGGRVSGPICNQIVYALKNEGYLDP